jgi:hypothetical protein
LLVSSFHCLDISLFEKNQNSKVHDFEQQQVGSKVCVP